MPNVLESHVFGNKSPKREVQDLTDANWTAHGSFQIENDLMTRQAAAGGQEGAHHIESFQASNGEDVLGIDAGKENGRNPWVFSPAKGGDTSQIPTSYPLMSPHRWSLRAMESWAQLHPMKVLPNHLSSAMFVFLFGKVCCVRAPGLLNAIFAWAEITFFL